jgi:hypothetical protein
MMQNDWMGSLGPGYMGWSGVLWAILVVIVTTVGIVDLMRKKNR